MKNYMNISRNLFTKMGAAGLIAIALSSCIKSNNNSYYNPAIAQVMFVQASPDQPGLDIYLNNSKVNQAPVNYEYYIDYTQVYTGKTTVSYYTTGTTNKVYSDSLTFLPNYAYSLFLANKASTPELVALTDSISQPAAGMASIRFINLSPDAPAVDLAVHGGSVVVTNKSYKGYTSFLPITGNTNYTFDVRQTGTNTVLATLPALKLSSGLVYTIVFRGLVASTNSTDGLSVGIITNAAY